MGKKRTKEEQVPEEVKKMREINKKIFSNDVPTKIINLLLKREMSPSDLAETIYGKKKCSFRNNDMVKVSTR